MNDIFAAIYIMGALQGFSLVAVLLTRKNNPFPNRILSILLGLFSLNLVNLAVKESSATNYSLFTAPFSFIYGPLLWLYVSALTGRLPERFRFRTFAHFIPFLTVLFILTPLGAWTSSNARFALLSVQIVQYAAYLSAALFALKRYEKVILGFFSTAEELSLRWLRIVITIDFVTLGIVALLFVLQLFGLYDLSHSHALPRVTFILSSLCIYVIGYFSLLQPTISPRAAYAADILEPGSIEWNEPASLPAGDSPRDTATNILKYEKSRLDDHILDAYKEELTAYMERAKPFIDPELTLQELADALSLSYHTLSQVINAGFNKNFYSFVNEYRVAEVKRLLAEAELEKSVLFLAFEAGFNSKSNFNNIFKKMTGMTPSEYRRSLVPADKVRRA